MSEQEHNAKLRPGTISVFMLALLAGSVGVAWWISHHRQAAGGRGNELMADLHLAGLKSFWGDTVQEQYAVMRRTDDGANIGWQMTLRKPAGDGYRGLDVRMYIPQRGSSFVVWESWSLRDDLRQGHYVALAPSNRVRDAVAKTEIALHEGLVSVTETLLAPANVIRPGMGSQLEPFQRVTSQAAAPENYLPEGSLPLVVQQVGARKTSASFAIVLNETQPLTTPEGRQTRFGSVRAEFSGLEAIGTPKPVSATIVTVTRGGFGHDSTERSYWSNDGDLLRTADDTIEVISVTQQELLSAFPKAMEELATLRQHADIGYDAANAESEEE